MAFPLCTALHRQHESDRTPWKPCSAHASLGSLARTPPIGLRQPAGQLRHVPSLPAQRYQSTPSGAILFSATSSSPRIRRRPQALPGQPTKLAETVAQWPPTVRLCYHSRTSHLSPNVPLMRTTLPLMILVASWNLLSATAATAQQAATLPALQREFQSVVKPFLKTYCSSCHGQQAPKAKLDLSGFSTLDAVRNDLGHWQLILERIDADEMPPVDADARPSPPVRTNVVRWIRAVRRYEANLNAGDPGLVLARRLSHADYAYPIRDLQEIKTTWHPIGQ